MELLQQMLQIGRLADFVFDLVSYKNEEREWEFYLHKVHGKSFDEFVERCKKEVAGPEEADMSKVETTVKASMDILAGFSL